MAVPEMIRREKRTRTVKAHITPSMHQQLQLFRGNVISMSDYLFELIEEHNAIQSVRIAKQKIGRRAGQQ